MILEILIILAGLYMGWNIGANDAANCVGADIGCGKMTIKEGIILTAIFSALGAVFFGSNVIKTVGKGIVPLNQIIAGEYAGIDPQTGLLMVFAAALSAGLWVMTATYLKLPVSTSHAVVGAVAGTGIVFINAAPDIIVWSKLSSIFISWAITPIGAALLAFLLYKPCVWLFGKLVPPRHEHKAIRFLLIATSAYLAFTWGANDVANATGIIAGTGISLGGVPITVKAAALVGAIAIIIGIVTMGRRVMETMGFGITNLLPMMAIVAEIASALNVTVYTAFGMPVSTSHSIIGAVAGVGLWHGAHGVNKKTLRDIGLACVGTPFIAGATSFIMMKTIFVLGLAG